MKSLSLLEKWYAAQCNDDWEHQYGVRIGTLDNPGWTLKIDLYGTSAEERSFQKVEIERSENDWLYCWVENKEFHAFTGPKNLTEAIETFSSWFENSN